MSGWGGGACTVCSMLLLPSMLGEGHPVQCYPEILGEAGMNILPELWCSVAAPCLHTCSHFCFKRPNAPRLMAVAT